MADANKTSIYFALEGSYGTQATGGAFTITPTSESLAHTQGFTSSQRIRDDRQIDDTIRNSIAAGGDTSIEWSYGEPHHELIQAAMLHDFSAGKLGFWDSETRTTVELVTDVEVTDSNTMSLLAGSWTNTPTVGNFVKVNGFSNDANNGMFRVTAATTADFDVSVSTLVPEPVSNLVRVVEYDACLSNGTATATTSQFTHATGWDQNPALYSWIYVSGFSSAGNNGYFKVTGVSNTTVTVSPAPTGGESAVSGVSIVQLPYLTNGTYLPSFTVERVFNDAAGAGSDLTDVFVGMCVDGMSMSVTPDAPVAGAFTWLGQKQSSAGTASVFSSPFPQAETRIFNGIDYVQNCWLGGTAVTPTQFDFTLRNNLRQRLVVGQLGPVSVGAGTIDVTGSIQLYLTDNTEYAKAIADTTSSLAFVLQDDDGNAYIFDFPNTHYGEPRRVAGGINTDVIVELPFQATRDPAENVTMRVAKL